MHLHMNVVVVGTSEWPDGIGTYRFIGPANGCADDFFDLRDG